ncbi:MAG: TraB/GumN family protein, partial [Flavobacteriales bacterium]
EDERGYTRIDYVELENAYRRQDLDYIDSIDTYVDSKAFNEYILHARNKVFVHTMDSVLRTGQSLFAGMGCAHLPGEKGVIESLRNLGYTVEPMDKGNRNTRRRNKLEKQVYNRKYVPSHFGVNQPSVMLPDDAFQLACNDKFASWVALDIPNGASFSVYRIRTNAALRGIELQQQELTLDSAIFEGLPGDLVHLKTYQLQGYKAWDIYNRTTRDDIHRMVVVLLENEIFLFKVTAGGEKIEHGYANEFFQSIRLPDNLNKASETSILPNQSLTWNHVNAHVIYASENPLFSSNSIAFAGVQHGKLPVGFIEYTFPEMSYIEESSYELRRLADAFMMDNSLNEMTYHESSTLKTPSANGFYQDADGRNYCARFYLKGLTYVASFVLC